MKPSIGLWLSSANGAMVEIATNLGIQTVLLDLEHGVFHASELESIVGLSRALGLNTLVKTSAPEGPAVMAALDRGASGIVVPQIRGIDHARDVTAYAKYPPNGRRGASGGRVFNYGPVSETFFADEDKNRPCYAMIETAGALADVEAIAALDTVDGLFVGPTDLALSCGRGCYRRDDADYKDIAAIARAAKNNGKPWIIPAWSPLEQQWAAELEASIVIAVNEHSSMRRGLEWGLSEATRELGGNGAA